MGLTIVEIEGYVVDAAGNAIGFATLKLKPTKRVAYSTTHVVVDDEVQTDTNDIGYFSFGVWRDDEAVEPVNYIVTIPTEGGGDPNEQYTVEISVPSGIDYIGAIPIGTIVVPPTE
jgi:hypothetical protein